MSEALVIFLFLLFALLMLAFVCYLGADTCCGRELLGSLNIPIISRWAAQRSSRYGELDDGEGMDWQRNDDDWFEMRSQMRTAMAPEPLRSDWERDLQGELWMKG
ncbi:hypothetical protein SpCBS45565_g04213 [Spizellomyces sp. 'palustris']|nr:hypothetical protein SpCBS45565_g04213 [Spizellomyces sp. 'palustris']